jgi:hypothetical protein
MSVYATAGRMHVKCMVSCAMLLSIAEIWAIEGLWVNPFTFRYFIGWLVASFMIN